MNVAFIPVTPWTPTLRAHVLAIASDMAEADHAEIFGLRPSWHSAENVVEDIGELIAARRVFDGFVAFRSTPDDLVPVAIALAYRASMPKVAELALFGRRGHARAMPEVYRELRARSLTFAADYGVRLAQVPVLTEHVAARRMLRALGGEEAFDYGPVGAGGRSYVHTIWRF